MRHAKAAVPLVVIAALAALALACQSAPRPAGPLPQAEPSADGWRFGAGELRLVEGVPVLVLRGSHADMGRQYGVLLRERIVEAMAAVNGLKRAAVAGSGLGFLADWGFALKTAQAAAWVPAPYRAEITAAAEAAGVSAADLIAFQAFHEMVQAGCLSFAVSTPTGLMHGRNLDYPLIFLGRLPAVVRYEPAGEIPYTIFSFAGYFGSLTGFNQSRLSLSVNAVALTRHDSLADLPLGFLLRDILGNADKLDAVEQALAAHRFNVGWIVTAAAAGEGRIASFDLAGASSHRNEPGTDGILVASNRFVSDEMQVLTPTAVSGDSGNLLRAATARRLLAAAPGWPCLESVQLGDLPQALGAGRATINRETTVFSLIIDWRNDRAEFAYAPGYAAWAPRLALTPSTGGVEAARPADPCLAEAGPVAARVEQAFPLLLAKDVDGLSASGLVGQAATYAELQPLVALYRQRRPPAWTAQLDGATQDLIASLPGSAPAAIVRADYLTAAGREAEARGLLTAALEYPLCGAAEAEAIRQRLPLSAAPR